MLRWRRVRRRAVDAEAEADEGREAVAMKEEKE
jgi:hypothetical protein